MPVTLKDLAGENTLTMVGTVAGLLKQVERGVPELKGTLVDQYRKAALSGDYANACAVTEEYAMRYLPDTLAASEGDLTEACAEDEVCDHCGEPTNPRQERECDECTERLNGVA